MARGDDEEVYGEEVEEMENCGRMKQNKKEGEGRRAGCEKKTK